MIRAWTRGQWVVRAVAALAPVLALLCTAPAGAWPRPWLVVLELLLAAGYASRPSSGLGVAALGLVLVWWGVAFRDGLHAWAVPSAALLVAGHLAGLVASYGPAGLGVDPATARLWLRRGLLVLLASPVVLGVAVALRGRADVPGVWVAGLLAALVAMVVASLALTGEE